MFADRHSDQSGLHRGKRLVDFGVERGAGGSSASYRARCRPGPHHCGALRDHHSWGRRQRARRDRRGSSSSTSSTATADRFAPRCGRGITADVTTLLQVVDCLQRRFSIGRVCVVADRGMNLGRNHRRARSSDWSRRRRHGPFSRRLNVQKAHPLDDLSS
jgi:hypothetical protein